MGMSEKKKNQVFFMAMNQIQVQGNYLVGMGK